MKHLFSIMTKKDKLFAAFAAFFTLLSAVCDLLNPFFFSKILNSIQPSYNKPLEPLSTNSVDWYYFGVLVGLAVLSLVFCILYTFFSVKLSMNMSTNIRMKLFSHTQELSSSDIDKIGSSTLLTRITCDITNVQSFILMLFTIAIKAICFILGGFILSIIQLIQFNGDPIIWTITSAYGLIFIFFFVVSLIMKKGMPIFKKSRVAIDENNKIMSENILGNRIIRAFNLENKQFKKYEVGNNNLKKVSIKAEGIFSIMMPFSFFIINFATVLIILFAGLYAKDIQKTPEEILKGFGLIGVIFSFIQYFMLIMVGLSLIGMFGFTFSRAKVSNDRVFEIINTEPSIKTGNKKMINGNIKFDNVSFSYGTKNGQSKNVLSNINLNIKQGQWLGIIGQTGSGKTTLVNLISRLYDATEGTVLVSDTNVKDLKLDSLRDNISVSLQEKILLHGTIKSNIMAGKTNATDKEIIEAAKMSESWEFIQKKDKGIDSIVEQRGNNLSGGQKQRLSIARALIKKPKILIFDDSTSALDTITEKKIINNLYKNFKDTTVVIVSQKVRSIQSCDQIIVLDNGKIVQHGKHNELMKENDGIYKKIYDSQSMSVES